MKNFPIIDKETGREYWISRSVAVIAFVYAYDKYKNKYILAIQRGKGTPDPEYIGKWCLPCGYLDYDESLNQAVSREVFEESGIKIAPNNFKFININSDPNSDKRQNVGVRFEYTIRSLNVDEIPLTSKYSEKDEVCGITFISINNIENYEWSFNHQELIKEISFKKEKTTTL